MGRTAVPLPPVPALPPASPGPPPPAASALPQPPPRAARPGCPRPSAAWPRACWRCSRCSAGWPSGSPRPGTRLALVGGSVRDALLGRLRRTSTSPPTPGRRQIRDLLRGWGDALWEVGIAFGTVGRPQGRAPGRDHDVPLRGLPQRVAQARGRPTATPSRATCVRRDFTVNAMAVALPEHDVRRPVRRAGRPRRRRAADAGPAGGLVLRRPAADAAGRPVRRPARASRSTRRCVAAMTAMADRIEIVSAERVRDELTKLLLAPRPAARACGCSSTPGWPTLVLPELPRAARWRSTSTTGTRTSTSTR